MAIRDALLAAGLLCLADQTATAGPLPDGGVTVKEMSDVLKASAYPIATSSVGGTPVINTSVNGIKFSIYFLECDPEGRCQSIEFLTSWSIPGITEARMQEWNRTKRLPRLPLRAGRASRGHGYRRPPWRDHRSAGQQSRSLEAGGEGVPRLLPPLTRTANERRDAIAPE